MNLRDIRTGEMVAVTFALLDPTGTLLAILESDDRLLGPRQELQKAHDRLRDKQRKLGSNEEQIEILTEEMTELDRDHDSLSSGIHDVNDGCITLADTPEEKKAFRNVQKTLHPQGRSIVWRSYREQAGTAKQVRDQLDDEQRALLKSVTVGSSTLLDKVDEWLDKAILIAKKESERAQLRREKDDDGVSLGEVRDARLDWMRAVRYLINSLEFADIDESEKSALLANIEEASDRARERAATSKDEVDPAPDQEPTVTDVDVSDEEPARDDEEPDVVEPAE